MLDLSNESALLKNAANIVALILSAGNLIVLVRVVVTKADFESFKQSCSKEFELFKAQFWKDFAEHKADQAKDELKNEKEHRDLRHDLRQEFDGHIRRVEGTLQTIDRDVKDLLKGSGARGNSVHPPSAS